MHLWRKLQAVCYLNSVILQVSFLVTILLFSVVLNWIPYNVALNYWFENADFED